MEKLFTKQNLAARLTEDDSELINDLLTSLGVDTPKTDRMLIMLAVETALSKKKPVEVSKPEDIAKIEQLTKLTESLNLKIDDMQVKLDNVQPEIKEVEKVVEKILK